MPRRYRKKKYRRRYNKRKDHTQTKGDKEVINTGRPKRDVIMYKGIGIPNVFFTKLKYSLTLQFNSSAYQEALIRMNNINDPVYALGGGQPMYYDELAALYTYYTVYGASATITFINKTNTTEAAFTKVGIYPLNTSTTAASIGEATERDYCTYAQLGPNTGDQGIITMSSYAKPYQVIGRDKDEAGDDTMTGTFAGSGPVQEPLWHIFAGTLDLTTTANVYADCVFTFYVKAFDRIAVARS